MEKKMIPLQKDKKEVFIMKNKIFVMKVVFNMPPPIYKQLKYVSKNYINLTAH